MELCPQCGWPHEAPAIESEHAVVRCSCGWSGPPREMLAIVGEIATRHVDLLNKLSAFHLDMAQAISPKVAQLLIKYEFVDPRNPSIHEFAHLLKDGTNAACRVMFARLFTEKRDATAEPGRQIH